MSDMTLKCPKCGTEIPLTEGIAAPMVAAVRTEMQNRIDIAISQAEEVERKAKAKEDNLEADLQARLKAQRELAEVSAKEKARAEMEADFACEQKIAVQAQQEAEALRVKLTEAQKAQAEALRKERELADRERELNLTIETQVSDQLYSVRTQAEKDANDANRLKLLEKDTLLESMQKKVEELNQKITQGSQQLQGEVQELDLEATLRTAFPYDLIEEVGKGANGADCSQVVRSRTGSDCGVILYESKRTKNWSPGWLPKLREDMRQAKAHIAVLVTQAMPADVDGFDCVDSVWVVQPNFVRPLATALRDAILRAHAASQAAEGMKSCAELVYQYMMGRQFRSRIEAIVEAFTSMQTDLEAEKRATLRVWAKREAQIAKTIENTAGMFGDLQGIAGSALPAPKGLELTEG